MRAGLRWGRLVLALMLLAAPLAACGKKAPPSAPGAGSYPRVYPSR